MLSLPSFFLLPLRVRSFNMRSAKCALSCVAPPTLAEIQKVVPHFVSVVDHLLKLGDFNGALAVWAGLKNVAISRLDHPQGEVGNLFSPARNYAALRQAHVEHSAPVM